jgi:hypothetical protein
MGHSLTINLSGGIMSKSQLERNLDNRKGGKTKSAICRKVIKANSGKLTLHEMAAEVMKKAQIECKYLARRYVERYAGQDASIKVLTKEEAKKIRGT